VADNNLIEATFATDDLEDWYKVNLEAGKLYYFNTADSKVGEDISVEIYADGSQTNLINDTPKGRFGSNDFRVSGWSPAATGTYLLKLSVTQAAFTSGNNGEYKLRAAGGEVLSEVAALHEPDNSFAMADLQTALSTDGEAVDVAFGDASDHDVFTIEGVEGQRLVVSLAPAHGPRWIRELDTKMSLYTSDSTALAVNDDYDDWYELEFYEGSVSCTYSQVIIDPLPASGTYYVDAYPYYGIHNGNEPTIGNNAVGSYQIWATMSASTGIEDVSAVPTEFALDQNYPNPFNPTTTIKYSLREAVDVKLEIYNVMGQKVATLVNNERQAPGNYQLIWDSTNDYGARVATGIYFYRLIAGDKFVKTNKMLLIK
jgi:hypothetical protein